MWGAFVSALRSLSRKVLGPLATERERRIRELTNIKLKLLEISDVSPRRRCRNAIKYVYHRREVLSSDRARSVVVGAYQYNQTGRMKCFRDSEKLEELLKEIEKQLLTE